MNMQNKGFTLIELLVVIAIIGILAGIIVVSMGGAQNAAKDAKVQSTLSQMRTAAQMYSMSHGNAYGTNAAIATSNDCDAVTDLVNTVGSDANFDTLCGAVLAMGGTTVPVVTVAINGASWCAQTPLQTTGSWCVDSTGYSGKTTVECSATVALC
ncbi:type II secretion system GspH family protein, partial [bacterium]|nr:type II secretion system GspH family protein [bacterium]